MSQRKSCVHALPTTQPSDPIGPRPPRCPPAPRSVPHPVSRQYGPTWTAKVAPRTQFPQNPEPLATRHTCPLRQSRFVAQDCGAPPADGAALEQATGAPAREATSAQTNRTVRTWPPPYYGRHHNVSYSAGGRRGRAHVAVPPRGAPGPSMMGFLLARHKMVMIVAD